MLSQTKISVIIPVFNEEKYISLTLKTLSEQSFKDFEVIIVDNNCTDKTISIIKNFIKIKNLKIVKEESSLISQIRQRGFDEARGEILVSTDADVKLPSNWLNNIANYFNKHPEVVAIGGPYSFYDERKLIKYSRLIVTPFFLFLDNLLSGWNHHFAACNFAVRRKLFYKVDGFSTNLDFGEDIELSVRLKKIGKVDFIDSIFMLTSARRYNGHMWKGVIYHFYHYLRALFFIKTKRPIKKDIKTTG
jgi:glycosyltransferase involved in cell wall biosynthesis